MAADVVVDILQMILDLGLIVQSYGLLYWCQMLLLANSHFQRSVNGKQFFECRMSQEEKKAVGKARNTLEAIGFNQSNNHLYSVP